MKICYKCKESLPETAFNRSSTRRDGLQGVCRTCQSAYHKANGSSPKEDPARLKRCPACDSRKPATLENFSPVRNNWDGMNSTCKDCRNQHAKEWNHAHTDHVRRRKTNYKARKALRRLGINHKVCLRCGEPKNLLEFDCHRQKIRNICNACRSLSQKQLSQTPMGKYKEYRKGAWQRNIAFELTFEQFIGLWQKPCAYCGGEITTIGIDRIDNATGYRLENCLPCHRRCNAMKSDQEFTAWVSQMKMILEHLGLKVSGDIPLELWVDPQHSDPTPTDTSQP